MPLAPAAADRLAPVEVDFTEALSDLHMVESRISALLAERGLQPRSRPPALDPPEDEL